MKLDREYGDLYTTPVINALETLNGGIKNALNEQSLALIVILEKDTKNDVKKKDRCTFLRDTKPL